MLGTVSQHQHHSLVGDPDQLGEALGVQPHDVRHGDRGEGLGALGLRGPEAKDAGGGLPEGELVLHHGIRGQVLAIGGEAHGSH